ncbi:phosphatidylserine decarboxylase [Polymorphobacter sp.]|uniref:phosphatidylserine decarboxylase n=1 Tax=Polymorphobacter sp. TaxID=1909290 RepID=UPI003F6ECDDE
MLGGQESAAAAGSGPLPLVPGESARYKFPSLHPEGRKFVGIVAAAVLLAGPVFGLTTLAWLLAGLMIWVAAFFRDPVRVTPVSPDVLVSPADGLVSLIVNCVPPRQLSGPGGLGDGPVTRVSVFMSVFDVHVNRTPIAGRLSRIVYVPGKFLNADLDKASDENERQYFVVEADNGERVAFTQIAGLVARRILRFVEEGARVKSGERIGLIRFGSRVDVYLPAGFVPEVMIGQRATAGETILARRRTGAMPAGVSQ